MAYTYLVGWSRLDVWYYGVRTAKASSPADLWVTYFTSSHRVKAFRAAHGEPDVVQVRQVFDNREAALRWEERVIDRIDAVWSPRWLNAQNAGRAFNSGPNGRPRSEACREKIRAKRLALLADSEFARRASEHCKEFTSRPEVKAKISAKAKERFADPAYLEAYTAARNTAEFKKAQSERTKAFLADPVRRANYDKAMQSDDYRSAKAEESRLRNADPLYRKRVSDTLKAKLADPDVRAAMSERASKAMKASHERRRLQRLGQQKSQ